MRDGGRAASIFQIQAPAADRERLFADRQYAISRALALVRRSFAACASSGPEALLTVYAAGNCESLTGRAKGRARLAIGRRIFDMQGPP